MANTNKLPIIVGGVVILAVAAGTFLVKRGDDAAPAAAVGVEPQPVAAPAIEDGAAARATAAAGTPRDRVADTMDRRRTRREAHIERTAKAKADAIARFESEAVDPAWAPQHERTLNDIASDPTFATAGATPQRLDVDCKSSMCRLDGQFASNGEAEDWVLLYMSSVGGKLPNSIVSRVANPDGTTSVQIYGRAR